MEPRLKVSATF